MALAHTPTKSPADANSKLEVTTADDGNLLDPNLGFQVDLDGSFAFRARGDSAIGTALPVLAGVVYPYDVAEVDFGASTTVTRAWLLRKAVL